MESSILRGCAATVLDLEFGMAGRLEQPPRSLVSIAIQREFIVFTVSFDGDDNGKSLWVPEWVAYGLRATPPDLGPATIALRVIAER